MAKMTPAEIKQDFVNRIIASIEEGNAPFWNRTFTFSFPQNFATRTYYSGFNLIMLFLSQAVNNYQFTKWAGYKQIGEWLEKNSDMVQDGAEYVGVRKGEGGTPISLPPMMKQAWEDGKRVFIDQTGCKHLVGKNETPQPGWIAAKYPIFRRGFVWNVSQIEGIDHEASLPSRPENITEAQAAAETYLIETVAPRLGVELNFGEYDTPHYIPSKHVVNNPVAGYFVSMSEYVNALAHELGHATKNSDAWAEAVAQQARPQDYVRNLEGPADMKGYSEEELVASFIQVTVMTMFGLATEEIVKNVEGYALGWSQAIKDNPDMVFGAARKAELAVKVMFGDDHDKFMKGEGA